jgi:chaperonin GroEL (HSP60 family)
MAEELGFADVVTVEGKRINLSVRALLVGWADAASAEIGSTKCTIFRQEAEDSRISTLVVRGATNNLLDDIERAVDDAVNVYKVCHTLLHARACL